MPKLISREALERLWKEKLLRLAPRLKYHQEDVLNLHFKEDLKLDSLETLDLYSSFMDLFALQLKADEQTYLYQFNNARDCIQAILEHLKEAQYLHFKSSGSSALPHGHLHSVEQLKAECDFWASLWSDTEAIYYSTNSLHIYGFIMSVLLPSKLAVPAQYFHAMEWHSLIKKLPENSLIITFPEALEHLPSHLRFPKNCRLISSTAPLGLHLQQRILAAGLELYKVYGSTETAGIAFAKNESASYKLLPFWSRTELGLKNTLSDKEQELLDHFHWQDEHHFTLGGRLDEVVQIGGHNVSLPLVTEAIKLAFPHEIKALWLRPMQQSEGRRLKAWLQIRDFKNFQDEQRVAIYNWIEGNLSPEARPKHLTFSSDKALNSLGKLKDWPIND